MRSLIPTRLALWGLLGILFAMPGIAQAWTSCQEFHKATQSTCCEQPVDACGCEDGIQAECACVAAPPDGSDASLILPPNPSSVVVLALAETKELSVAPVECAPKRGAITFRATRAPPDIGPTPDSPRGPPAV